MTKIRGVGNDKTVDAIPAIVPPIVKKDTNRGWVDPRWSNRPTYAIITVLGIFFAGLAGAIWFVSTQLNH